MTRAIPPESRPNLRRRIVVVALLASLVVAGLPASTAFADSGSGSGGSSGGSSGSGGGGNSGSGSGNSGKGSDNSGKGSGTSGKDGGDDGDHGDHGKSAARDGLRRGELLSVSKIVASARRAHPGQVLALNLRQSGSALVYDVKLLDAGGSVVIVRVDARTAVALSVRGG